MTLRRCDSLPTRLREAPVPAGTEPRHKHKKSPDTTTTALNFNEAPNRDQVIATWNSLHTDVKKIKNGFLTKNEPPNRDANKKGSITNNFIPTIASNNRDLRRKITYDNRQIGAGQEVDRSSSFPLDPSQANTAERGAARKKTLLRRLLSWRTPDCDCREKYMPKNRPQPRLTAEDLLCTCGASAVRFKPVDKTTEFAERGRSKSVGYEVAREVTQFRRCASAGATVGVETAAALRARAALTLARRYYPEGGWGWTITVVGTIVQVLSHGLQLGGGTGAIACTAAVKFKVSPLYTHECGFVLDMVDKMKSGVDSVVDWKVNAVKCVGTKVNTAIEGVGSLFGKEKHKIIINSTPSSKIPYIQDRPQENMDPEDNNSNKDKIKYPDPSLNQVGNTDENISIDIRIRAEKAAVNSKRDTDKRN